MAKEQSQQICNVINQTPPKVKYSLSSNINFILSIGVSVDSFFLFLTSVNVIDSELSSIWTQYLLILQSLWWQP